LGECDSESRKGILNAFALFFVQWLKYIQFIIAVKSWLVPYGLS